MRAVRGIEVNEETLSVDLIDQVARGEGHYLGTKQSLELMRTEYYYPHSSDRQIRDAWVEAGSLDMRQRARLKAREILNTHKPEPIPPEIDDEIRHRFEILLPPEWAYQVKNPLKNQ
jgi:trimethylamine--corrinoid protein Co-methyltransferase